MQKVRQLYGQAIGDDASMVGIFARQKRMLNIFTGPPLDRQTDEMMVEYFLSLPGRHVVCGGTTGNIVARMLDETPEIVVGTMRPDVPPIAIVREVDLMTEGILTLNKAVELLRGATQISQLPEDGNGAVLLAKEMLSADAVRIIAGQRINDCYQNPTLPPNLSLRKNLVGDLVKLLQDGGKEVSLEWC